MEHRTGRLAGLAAVLGIGAALASPSSAAGEQAPAPARQPKREPGARPSKWKTKYGTTGRRRGSPDEQQNRQLAAQAKRHRRGARNLRHAPAGGWQS